MNCACHSLVLGCWNNSKVDFEAVGYGSIVKLRPGLLTKHSISCMGKITIWCPSVCQCTRDKITRYQQTTAVLNENFPNIGLRGTGGLVGNRSRYTWYLSAGCPQNWNFLGIDVLYPKVGSSLPVLQDVPRSTTYTQPSSDGPSFYFPFFLHSIFSQL